MAKTRHVPSFIEDLCKIRVKKPQLKPGIVDTTQSHSGASSSSTSQPITHTIDPNEGIDPYFTWYGKINANSKQQQQQQSSSQPTHMPSRPSAASSSSSTAAPHPSSSSSSAHLSVPTQTFHGKLTPARRAQLAAQQAAAAKEAEEKEAAAAAAAMAAKAAKEAQHRATTLSTKPAAAIPHKPMVPPAAAAAAKPSAHKPAVATHDKPKPAPAKPSTAAAGAKKRPACPFGASCYRKNPQHRIDESHPGDKDFPGDDDDVHMDVDEDEEDKPASKNIVTGKRKRKAVNYKDEPNNSDEEAEFEEPENSYDRAFIDSDSDPEVYGSDDDDWGSSKSKKKKKKGGGVAKKKGGGRKKKKHSDDDSEDEEFEPDVAAGGAPSSDDDDEDLPLDEEELPKCKYGRECTRKNPQHYKEERHPHVDTNMKPKVKKAHKHEDADDLDDDDAEPKKKKAKTTTTTMVESKKPSLSKPATPSAAHLTTAAAHATVHPDGSPSPPTPILPISAAASAQHHATSAAASSSSAAAHHAPPLVNIFSRLECVLYGNMDEGTRKQITRFWRAYDGDIADSVSNSTTHVIVDDNPLNAEVTQWAKEYEGLLVVQSQWAIDCIRAKKLLSEKEYLRIKA